MVAEQTRVKVFVDSNGDPHAVVLDGIAYRRANDQEDYLLNLAIRELDAMLQKMIPPEAWALYRQILDKYTEQSAYRTEALRELLVNCLPHQECRDRLIWCFDNIHEQWES